LKEKRLLEISLTQFEEGALNLMNLELTVDDQVELLPYDKRFKFPRENIKLDKQLGSGAFGVVFKAVAYELLAKKSTTIVAVKTVHRNADLMSLSALARELKIMNYLGPHLNIISLLGACTKNIAKRKLLVIIELCRFGNLESYLLCHRKHFINQIEPTTGKIDHSIGKRLKRAELKISDNCSLVLSNRLPNNESSIYCTEDQTFIGPMKSGDDFINDDIQSDWRSSYKRDYVANGMEYLSKKKVLHCDLAARNILLGENNIIKICDFGLAKTLYKDENYKKQCVGKLPVKWMATESIRDGVFLTMSDMWSFGVVLWELFTLADIPYSDIEFEEMFKKLIKGYDIMLHCWEEEPMSRPSFTMLVESIGKMLQNDIKTYFQRLYHEYENFNREGQFKTKDNSGTSLLPDYTTIPLIRQNYVNTLPPIKNPSYINVLNSVTVVELHENTTFDPRVGYIMRDTEVIFDTIFTCEVIQRHSSYTVKSKVIFTEHDKCVNLPEIIVDGPQHITTGSRLSFKCLVEVRREATYNISWKVPQNSTSRIIPINTKEVVKKYIKKNIITSELIFDNATVGDTGNYECQVTSSFNERKSSAVYICVYDSNNPYINLTSVEKKVTRLRGESVTFVANVSACPKPILKWVDNYGGNFYSLARQGNLISRTHSNTARSLRIDNISIVNDGIYTLTAKSIAGTKNITFHLKVLDEPSVRFNRSHLKKYYSFNQTAMFVCLVKSNVEFNISWSYMSKPSQFQYIDKTSELQYLRDTKINKQSNRAEYKSIVTIRPQEKSTIKCTACNSYGCNNDEYDIYITDGVSNKAYGVIQPNTKYREGQNISLICYAVIHEYSEVYWRDNTYKKVMDSERIHVIFEENNYAHRAVMSINNLSYLDEKNYYCSAKKSCYEENSEKYFLKINVPAHFVRGNMNDVAITRLANDPKNPIRLACHFEGIPTPNITWFKDGTSLNTSNQFTFEDRNQKLIIRYLLENDSGNYSCVAENGFGPVTKSQCYGGNIMLSYVTTFKKYVVIIGISSSTINVLNNSIFLKKKSHSLFKEKKLLEAGFTHFEEGAIDLISPELMIDDQADLLPYDKRWEISRENVRLGKELGSGAFGVVYKAEAHGIIAEKSISTVAVKTIRKNADLMYISTLAKELKIMIYLGQHLNVINLLGACTKNIAKRELLVIVEFCRFGNLRSYLLCHRKNFINQIDSNTGNINPRIENTVERYFSLILLENRTRYEISDDSRTASCESPNNKPMSSGSIVANDDFSDDDTQPDWRSNYQGDYTDENFAYLCTEDLLIWAYQVANGMEYLTRRKVLHCDLAARNILLAENNIVKICDFGLAKTLYKDQNYKKQHEGKFPVKWMPIESIRDGVFSTMSDVWSFGVVLWEFFTLAEIPYSRMGFEKMYQKLIKGYRLGQPAYATKDIYNIMLHCWEEEPTSRPSFTILVESIGKLLQDNAKTHFLRLYHGYENFNRKGQLKTKEDNLLTTSLPDDITIPLIRQNYINTLPKIATPSYENVHNDVTAADTKNI
ncbi:vascular endothelial growth factor receptor 3-like, partial [Copidosoma floridanum]|uniref:vascular endothelial growth factor receptor 3-like n=1 Tax=Copidosoma floridanum TaxID=29053 RepID=UPI0006C9D28E